MNYTLSSTRNIGKNFQKIIVTHNDAPLVDDVTLFLLLKGWHTAINDLNNSDVGDINFNSFIDVETTSNFNTGLKADVSVTVNCNLDGVPRITMFEIADTTRLLMTTRIIDKMNNLYSLIPNQYQVVSVLINLHD